MTIAVADTFEPAGTRSARWVSALIGALLLHASVIVAAITLLPHDPAEEGGLFMMELPPLAIAATSSEPDNSENAKDLTTAPPPSDANETVEPAPTEVQPADPAPIENTDIAPPVENVATPVEPEPEPVPVDDTPPIPEAPVIEPEVTLPKPVEKDVVEPAPIKKIQEKKNPEQRNSAKTKAEPVKEKSKDGPRSNSKAASAAAASGGKFSPNAISRPHPAYPAGARAARIEGYVVVRYSVAASGSVTSVSVINGSPPGVFNGATVAAVRQWRFRPSAGGGSGTTTIRFKLR